MMRRLAIVVALLAAAACGGDDEMMKEGGSTLQNVTATALSGRSSSASQKLWACMTWEPAGVTTGTTHKVVVGCGVILPDPSEK